MSLDIAYSLALISSGIVLDMLMESYIMHKLAWDGDGATAVADRRVSGPWGRQICEALCQDVTQRFPAGFLGARKAPSGVRGTSEANIFWQQYIEN